MMLLGRRARRAVVRPRLRLGATLELTRHNQVLGPFPLLASPIIREPSPTKAPYLLLAPSSSTSYCLLPLVRHPS